MDETLTLDEALEDLSTAEEFLDFFGVAYDQTVVHVNRLHILQRFHDYITRQSDKMPGDESGRVAFYREWLTRSYNDFVNSSAQEEKVFRVFHTTNKPEGGHTAFISLDKVFQ